MTVVGSPVHLAAGNDIDAGDLLVEHRRLAGPVLGVRHRSHRKLSDREQPVQRFVPVRHAVGPITVVAYLGILHLTLRGGIASTSNFMASRG